MSCLATVPRWPGPILHLRQLAFRERGLKAGASASIDEVRDRSVVPGGALQRLGAGDGRRGDDARVYRAVRAGLPASDRERGPVQHNRLARRHRPLRTVEDQA